jgi:hypothetical protein
VLSGRRGGQPATATDANSCCTAGRCWTERVSLAWPGPCSRGCAGLRCLPACQQIQACRQLRRADHQVLAEGCWLLAEPGRWRRAAAAGAQGQGLKGCRTHLLERSKPVHVLKLKTLVVYVVKVPPIAPVLHQRVYAPRRPDGIGWRSSAWGTRRRAAVLMPPARPVTAVLQQSASGQEPRRPHLELLAGPPPPCYCLSPAQWYTALMAKGAVSAQRVTQQVWMRRSICAMCRWRRDSDNRFYKTRCIIITARLPRLPHQTARAAPRRTRHITAQHSTYRWIILMSCKPRTSRRGHGCQSWSRWQIPTPDLRAPAL